MKRILFAILTISVGFAAGLVVTGRLHMAETSTAAPAVEAQNGPMSAQPAPAARAMAGLPDFTGVAAGTVGAVTNISSQQVAQTSSSPFANDPVFRYFFGDDAEMFGGRDRRETSLGSGVIVSSDGYVLTNNHVVGDNMAEITVALADKRELRARVIGTDPLTDIALLKVNATGLPVVPWGDSSKLKVAEWVLAIGNPFQLNQTVTLGIVSAIGRTNVGVAAYEDFIQTDAAINPGNSGGALINARGELIGINTAIYSQSGGYQGVGFAVPSNLARRVMNDLIKYGSVRRGSIGTLEVIPLTSQVAEQVGVTTDKGVFVNRMSRNSPAYNAGIRPGDVIVAVNGRSVTDNSQLVKVVADAPIGGVITIGAIREGKRVEFRVPVEAMSTGNRPARRR
ncbi:MAG: trypsin-like peptidase domain-containing protein [Acidobacteria bacterium]|nr:trypsin-like peptidase domain-containing protein [Acidobacteriota bacterium]